MDVREQLAKELGGESIYDKYLSHMADADKRAEAVIETLDPSQAEPKDDPVEEPIEEPKVEPEAKEEYEPSESEEDEKETEEKEEQEEKTVPLAALHAEREKRKALRKENRELKQRLDDLETRQHELLQSFKQELGKETVAAQEGETLEDVATVGHIRRLEKELEALKKANLKNAEVSRQEAIRNHEMKVANLVDKVDAKLTKNGMPGFKEIGADMVLKEINAMAAVDPDEAEEFRNPEGWMEIYSEKIFPKISGMFKTVVKQEKVSKKLENKEKANLISGPGAPRPSEPEKDDWTREDWLKVRRTKNFSN